MSSPDRPTRRSAALLLIGAMLGLAGCGFQPLYGDATTSYAAQDALAQIKIAPLSDRVGQQLRNDLIRELSPAGEPYDAPYTLNIQLNIQERDVFVRESSNVERRTVTLTARYRLVVPETEEPVIEATAFTEASYNRFESEFANIRARIDAENRAAADLAAQIRDQLAAALVSNRA